MPSTSSYSTTTTRTTLKWSTVGRFMTAPILRSSPSRRGKENGMFELPGKKPLGFPSTTTLVEDGKTSSGVKVTVEGGGVTTRREERFTQLNGGHASSSRISLSTLSNLSSSQIRRSSPGASAIQQSTVAEETDIGLSPLAALDPTGPPNSVVPPSSESPHLFEFSKSHISIPAVDGTPRGSSGSLEDSRVEELSADNERLTLEIQALKDELAQTRELEQSARTEAEENLIKIRGVEDEKVLLSESIKKITGDLDDARRDQVMLQAQLDETSGLARDFKEKYDGLLETFQEGKREVEQLLSEAQLRYAELEKEKTSMQDALDAALLEQIRIRGQYEGKETELEAERKHVVDTKVENNRLEESLRTRTADFEEHQQAMMKTSNDLEVTRVELSRVQSGWDSSQKQSEESQEKVTSLESQLLVAERERETLEGLQAQQKRTLEEVLAELEYTRTESKEARKSLREKMDQVESLEEEKRGLLNEQQTKAKELDIIQELNERVKSELSAALLDLTNIRGEQDELNGRLIESEKRNEDSAKQSEVLLEELAKLRAVYTEKDDELKAAIVGLKKTELDRNETQARLGGRIRNLVDERQEGLKELETLRGIYEKTEGSLEAAVSDLKCIQVEWKETREQLEASLHKSKELEKENKESEKRNMRLLEEWQAKEKEVKEVRESNVKTGHALETSLSELERLRRDLKATHSRLEDTTKRHSVLEDQTRYLEEAFASKEKERNMLWEENYKQSQAVESAISEMRASWQREADTQGRLRDAEKRLEEVEMLNDELEERNRLLALDAARPLPALPGLVRAFIRPGALW